LIRVWHIPDYLGNTSLKGKGKAMLQKTPERAAQLDEFASYLEKLPRAKLSFHSWCTCIAGHAIKEYGTDEERRIIRGGVESSAILCGLLLLHVAFLT
jgi:hypothetical protein